MSAASPTRRGSGHSEMKGSSASSGQLVPSSTLAVKRAASARASSALPADAQSCGTRTQRKGFAALMLL